MEWVNYYQASSGIIVGQGTLCPLWLVCLDNSHLEVFLLLFAVNVNQRSLVVDHRDDCLQETMKKIENTKKNRLRKFNDLLACA